MYDVAVVGKGLFGAAAARHLARAGRTVALIGPDEPKAGGDHLGPFGAHYDEARILVARGDAAEVALTELAMSGMAALEAELDVSFMARTGTVEVRRWGSAAPRLMGGVSIPADSEIAAVPPPQGFFNPRRYLDAAVADAERHGAVVVRQAGVRLEAGAGDWTVTAADGGSIAARAVVVACGAWSNSLLDRPLALRRKREYVMFAELGSAEARSMSMQPTVVHGLLGAVESVYALPPLIYPDGNWYLKLGANTLFDRAVDPARIDDWYRVGDSDEARDDLAAAFAVLFPDVAVTGFHTDRCVITYTVHGRPYIDEVGPRLYCATGGNGHGASWADGAGRVLAARLTAGDVAGIDMTAFTAVHEEDRPEWPRPLLLRDRPVTKS